MTHATSEPSSRAGDAAARVPVAEDGLARRRTFESYQRLPISFTPNAGLTDGRVQYLARATDTSFYFTRTGIALGFSSPTGARDRSGATLSPAAIDTPGSRTSTVNPFRATTPGLALQLRFLGADPKVRLEAAETAPGTLNYLVGSRSRWRRELPTYRQIAYRELWPGIDLVYRDRGGVLKYELRVAPRADVRAIRLAYSGAERLSLGADGELLIHTALGTLTDAAPVSHQRVGGRRVSVVSRFQLRGPGSYGFVVGRYDHTRRLVIDPGIAYSTFLGGTGSDEGLGVAVDGEGSAYVTGRTSSPDYPTAPGAYDTSLNGGTDAFVTKLNPSGSGIVYTTLIGGTDTDEGDAIAVDAQGSAYIAGQTFSADFPATTGAFDSTYNAPTAGEFEPAPGGSGDAFVAKLDSAGSALSYSTFLGATNRDAALSIALDPAGGAYVTGFTSSTDYPTTLDAFDATHGGATDAFLTKLDPSGSALAYSTFLGGTSADAGFATAIDAEGSAYVTGRTASADYPVSAGAYDSTLNGSFDVFVTKLGASGSALAYSTLLGGTDLDGGTGIALDPEGGAYVTGLTASADYPTTPGGAPGRSYDAFMTRLDPSGATVVCSRLLGGTGYDTGSRIALDPDGGAYVAGVTSSADYPTTRNALDSTLDGTADAFVTVLRHGPCSCTLAYSTLLGGTNYDAAFGIALAIRRAGRSTKQWVYITGQTLSEDYPTTPDATDPTPNGNRDAFVTKLKIRRPHK